MVRASGSIMTLQTSPVEEGRRMVGKKWKHTANAADTTRITAARAGGMPHTTDRTDGDGTCKGIRAVRE